MEFLLKSLKLSVIVCGISFLVLVLLQNAYITGGQEKTDTKLNIQIPERAVKYLPILANVIIDCWPEVENPDVFAGQCEQETCPSLKSNQCWNPRTEFKTSRELGFGISQITIAYDEEGRERFNNFKVATKLDKVMKDWRWEDRYNPYYQLRFLVLYDKQIFGLIKWSDDELVKFAFTLAAYNGGLNGMIRDRKMCESVPGCNKNIWFDNVEKHSWRSKIKISGYGKSFFEINREYVSKILKERRFRYIDYWTDPNK